MTETVDRSDSVRMAVKALVMDPVSNMPVVILEQTDESSYLPIWIGVCEANSIALSLEGVTTPRPMTHDLIGSLIHSLGYTIDHVYIHSLTDSVFIASIVLRDGAGAITEVDSRPSDALAVALRVQAEVWVHPSVLEQARVGAATEEETLRMILERLRPQDLGEYEM